MVGLEVTVVQTGLLGLLASSSADFHIQHVFQAFHYLKRAEGRAWFSSAGMAPPPPGGDGLKIGGEDALMGLVHVLGRR